MITELVVASNRIKDRLLNRQPPGRQRRLPIARGYQRLPGRQPLNQRYGGLVPPLLFSQTMHAWSHSKSSSSQTPGSPPPILIIPWFQIFFPFIWNHSNAYQFVFVFIQLFIFFINLHVFYRLKNISKFPKHLYKTIILTVTPHTVSLITLYSETLAQLNWHDATTTCIHIIHNTYYCFTSI